jgi:hypothetical protein
MKILQGLDKEKFTEAFLKAYLQDGFTAMTKREMRITIQRGVFAQGSFVTSRSSVTGDARARREKTTLDRYPPGSLFPCGRKLLWSGKPRWVVISPRVHSPPGEWTALIHTPNVRRTHSNLDR